MKHRSLKKSKAPKSSVSSLYVLSIDSTRIFGHYIEANAGGAQEGFTIDMCVASWPLFADKLIISSKSLRHTYQSVCEAVRSYR